MKSKILQTVFAGLMLSVCNLANAGLITFDAGSPIEEGFTISSLSGSFLFGELGNSNIPTSGTPSLLVNRGTPASINMQSTTGELFNLLSFFGSEGRNINTSFFPRFGAEGIEVTGYFATGGSIQSRFDLDLIAEFNPLLDFQKFDLIGFNDLSRATFTAYGATSAYSFGIDNIEFSQTAQVAGPSTLVIFALGIMGLAARRFKKR
ncbi:hypothetical protein ISG33_02215 [Glaciecola sp. MH2013]|uniref:hypothetical protein n=1 Tax=Glaciecola sp. MH2013 TaxID=2785524 RepID=UPI00189EAD87|nr:hypothetical protein [Glaciecola sp. MH2013]MBF7072215.1 hypothetical protein [Glaciecola sp. MH2013]